MYQWQTARQQLKDKDETPTVMVHAGYINKTTTLFLPTEYEWMQATSEDNDLVYINNILFGTKETLIEPK